MGDAASNVRAGRTGHPARRHVGSESRAHDSQALAVTPV
jgi:hypothetical protein